jgi:NAD(P)-dependent dehydrogenase (short-subunit alcohol dehydrogenase family)
VNLKGVFGCSTDPGDAPRERAYQNTASFVALVGAATPQIATAGERARDDADRDRVRSRIRANALCPGPVDTPLLKELFSDPARRARRMVHIPPGRLAQAREIAQAALFLASDESSYVNGATFTVDGGITAAYVTPE